MKNNAYKYLIMLGKYTCYAYLFAVVLIHTAAAEASHAQGAVRVDEATVSLQIKNKTLLEAFRMLESKTRYSFIYNPDEMSNSTRITSQGGRRTVKTVLLDISQQANVSFRQVNNRISVKAHKGPNFDRHIDMIIEQQQIRGTVKDEDGQPLPGATVQEKGTTNGTITDANGQYTLSVSDDAVLIYSFVGYSTTEVPVDGQTVIDISLTFDTSTLGEVVVVGYGTQTRRDLTGSIVSVKPEEFTKGVNYDAVQLLNGAAAGVAVSQVSSAPGAELRIQIRGAGSINSSNQVLFVVDGLPGVNPQSLSPLDIESMEVLKDASAAAIYGTRAANGVVLITTKKGASGRTSLSYSAFAGIQSVTEQLDVLGARDYAELVNLRSPGTYTQDEINGFGGGTDWQDEIFRNAPVQNHQLSMSGGNEKSNYYVGINYFNQQGVVKRSASEKYNVRLNLRANPLENLVVSTNINYTRQSDDQILFSNAANENAGPINSAIQFDPTLPAGLDDNGRYFLNPSIALDNPVALINGLDINQLANRLYGSLTADYEVVNNLTATLRLGAEANQTRLDSYRDRQTLAGLANGGIGSVQTTEFSHWLAEGLLKYENTFGNDHSFSLLGGITFEEFLTRELDGSASNFLSDVTGTNNLQGGDGDANDDVASSKIKNQLNGFIGRATYDYQGKYLLTASFRIDGSSRFSEENKYAFFPSGSIGWRLSKESFLADVAAIDDLKLRVGYGELGNQGIDNFETRQTLIAGGNSVFGGSIVQGVVAARLPNPDLTWETTREVNVGLDFGVLGNRISGSIDFFNRVTVDQLFNRPLPSVVGFNSVRVNLGEVRNRGVDIGVKTVNIEKGDFRWTSFINGSFLSNEVTELPDFAEEIIQGNIGTFINQYTVITEGAPLRAFYGFEIDGMFQQGDDIASAATPFSVDDGYAAGMPRFVDQNGDGEINAEDRVVLGDPFPDFSFGFNNRLEYKNLSLEVFIQGVQGIESLDANVTESLYPTNSFRNSISRYYLDRWTPENPTNELPSGENANLYGGAFAINSLTVVDASFIRFRNITLGYNVPVQGWASSLGVYVAADNLITITDFESFDPDASAQGGQAGVVRSSYNSYPLARTFRLGVDVTF